MSVGTLLLEKQGPCEISNVLPILLLENRGLGGGLLGWQLGLVIRAVVSPQGDG